MGNPHRLVLFAIEVMYSGFNTSCASPDSEFQQFFHRIYDRTMSESNAALVLS